MAGILKSDTTIETNNEQTSGDLDALRQYIEETLDDKLTQVFTSVSDGKRLLASALLTIGTNLGKEDATFTEISNAIMHSQDVDPSIAATTDDIAEGKVAWVNGELVTGTKNGTDDAKVVLYEGITKEYNIEWVGNNSVSVTAGWYNRYPASQSAAPYVDISTTKTPDGLDGVLVNINLHMEIKGALGPGYGTAPKSNSCYVSSADGTILGSWSNATNNTTANYTYQLIGTQYQYDTIRAGGSMSAGATYTHQTDSSSYALAAVKLYGTITYLVPEN